MNNAPIDQLTTGGAAVMRQIDQFVAGSNVNVLYKAFALVAVLIVLAMIPATSKYAVWAAWIILALLLVQRNP